jgi:hypothetical protein
LGRDAWYDAEMTSRYRGLSVVVLTLAACGGDDGRATTLGLESGILTFDTGVDTNDADTSGNPGDGDPGDGDPGDGDGDDGGPKFDMSALPDSPSMSGPIIPETCQQALAGDSTVGCLFFGVDLDSHDQVETAQFAIAVSNVQVAQMANVQVEQKNGGVWSTIAGPTAVAPLSLYTFNLPDFHQDDSGVKVGGAYRVTSDVPIIAYQFNPVDGASSYLSDASMLYPVPTWDSINHVVGWKVIDDGAVQGAYLTVVAAHDGTQVTITPTAITLAGNGIPPSPIGVPFVVNLDEGDIAEVMTKTMNQGLTGTRVTSDVDHPVAVFSGNECTFIPTNVYACDHLEEQLSGVRLWGQNFAAGRVPVRWEPAPETSLWQIYAAEDGTTVTITAHQEVTGLPNTPAMLNQGEKLEFFAGGTPANPGDLLIEANKPIAVTNYMTGFGNLPSGNLGDPAMVQLAPYEQFLPRHVVLVPDQWTTDVLVITQPTGATVTVDGVAIPPDLYHEFGDDWEAARYLVPDGVHQLEGTEPFSVVVVGYDGADSYAYLGGSSTGKINPDPQG